MYMDTRKTATDLRLAHWAGIMRERVESGLSIRAYCKQAGFHENSYFYWQKKLREAACSQLISDKAVNRQGSMTPLGFTEVKICESSNRPLIAGAGEQGAISFDVGGVKFSAGNGYPASLIAELVRRLT